MTAPDRSPGEPGGAGARGIDAHGATDRGLVRDENQDSFAIVDAAGDGRGVLLVVADGMGGLEGGGTASRIVVETLCEAYRARGNREILSTLRDAVREANSRVYLRSSELPDPSPMGSTVTAVAISGRSAWVVHVGDSRAYRVPPSGPMVRLTRDHSWVEELTRRGEITPGSALYSLHRNVLTRGIGLRPEVEVDASEVRDLSPGDLILLTTDGLHELVGDAEIESRSRARGKDLPGLAADLIGIGLEHGGPDNITVVLGRIDAGRPAAEPSVAPSAADGRPATPEMDRPLRQKGFLALSLIAAFALAMGTVLLLQGTATEDRPAPRDDLLEGVFKDLDVPARLPPTSDSKDKEGEVQDRNRKSEAGSRK